MFWLFFGTVFSLIVLFVIGINIQMYIRIKKGWTF